MEIQYKRRMRRILCFFLLVFMISTAAPVSVYAADAGAVSTMADESGIYIYVKGISDIQADSQIQIGNKLCEPDSISVSPVSQLNIPVRTIILWDNSKSIPSKNHERIQEIMIKTVENALENEQFKIAVISDKVDYLCDFTSDKEVLRSVIEGIDYRDQDTYLSDILYNVIQEQKKDTAAYARIVVISDGADDKNIGYTNDEVLELIQESQYQIYTIGMTGKNNTAELETMFSFSRASKSGYFLLDEDTSNEEILSALLADQENLCIRIVPEESMKDGSSKKILLRLSTAEGMQELVTSVDMPFGNGITEETVEEEKLQEESESVEQKKEELPTLSPNAGTEAKEKKSADGVFLWVCGVIFILILIAGISAVIFFKKKKSVSLKAAESVPADPIIHEMEKEEEEEEETVFAGYGAGRDQAIGLWNIKEKNYIVLTNTEIPNMVYQAEILDQIGIGRKGTDIEISGDSQVSRLHCCIILRGELLYIKDHESKNGTFYECMRIYDETPIISGGKVQIGKYTYKVELVKQ